MLSESSTWTIRRARGECWGRALASEAGQLTECLWLASPLSTCAARLDCCRRAAGFRSASTSPPSSPWPGCESPPPAPASRAQLTNLLPLRLHPHHPTHSHSIILPLLLSLLCLLSATLYLSSRRHTLVPVHRQAFAEVAWDVYSPRLARGLSVSRRLDRQAARDARGAASASGGLNASVGRRAEAERKRRAQDEAREGVAAAAAEAEAARAEGRPEMGERKETVVDFAVLPALRREPSVKRIPKVGSVGVLRQDSAMSMQVLREGEGEGEEKAGER